MGYMQGIWERASGVEELVIKVKANEISTAETIVEDL